MVKSRRPLAGGAVARPATPPDTEVGFAKLQGEDFEYYMQTYSITLGRISKKHRHSPGAGVDVDLGCLGGGMNVSRRHARIFYDFARRRFALEVLGRNGCLVEGVLHVPPTPPVKLDSQDLLQMGDTQFYFLLPSRSVFHGAPVPRLMPAPVEEDEEEEEEEEVEVEVAAKRTKRGGVENGVFIAKPGAPGHLGKKSETRSRSYREADNEQLLQLEEKDVISCVATVVSDLCGPGHWMPMRKLHEVLLENYGNIWHHSRVRKYLTSEDWREDETDGTPWFGLLTLLRKYPEHFVINIRKTGQVSTQYVSLVSLLS